MKEFIVKEYETFPYKNAVNEMPELIRCKDCKHWDGKYHYCEIIDDSRDWDAYDYCSIAERKEE